MRQLLITKVATALTIVFTSGCAVPNKPTEGERSVDRQVHVDSAFTNVAEYGNAPRNLIELDGMNSAIDFSTNIEARAVRDAGRRLGATAGYNEHSKKLYAEVEQYDNYLSKIFDFQSLMLPNGIVPPVIAQTDRVVRYQGDQQKTITARVYRPLKEARFANPRAPSWRDYLNLGETAIDYPLPQLKETIEEYSDVWEEAVEEGWVKGHEQAKHAFDVAVNRIERDFMGMQLFHAMWVAKMVEPPRVVEQESNVVGGGPGSNEMSVGVRKVVITEDVYFVNDSSQWNAIISDAFSSTRQAATGLGDIASNIDNTGRTPEAVMDPDLRRVSGEH